MSEIDANSPGEIDAGFLIQEAQEIKVGIASGTEYRKDQRYEVEGDAEVIARNNSSGMTVLRGRILDISSTGCYIQTMARAPISPETEVHIVFTIYGIKFSVTAVSRFAKAKVGIGFRFFEMNDATRQRLHSVLADIRSKAIKDDPDGELPVVERMKLD